MHARHFNLHLGRFLSTDPIGGSIGSSQSWSRYSYVLGHPINATDPTGTLTVQWGGTGDKPLNLAIAGTADTVWDVTFSSAPELPHMNPNAPGRSRYDMVILGGGGLFDIDENLDPDGAAPWYEFSSMSQVGKYEKEIDVISAILGVDARLVKAIMYVETTHGASYGCLADLLHRSDTILPMNVSVRSWGRYFAPSGKARAWLSNPVNNIIAGAVVVRGIASHVSTSGRKLSRIRKIATLYNNLYASSVTNYGARVGVVYAVQPWK